MLEIAADASRAVIFSSHIVSDLERVANRIWILRDGVLLWDGDTDELKQSVKRLYICARRPLPADLGVPRTLSLRRGPGDSTATFTVRDPDHSLLPRLEQRLDAHVECEGLGLEDIFLEIHS